MWQYYDNHKNIISLSQYEQLFCDNCECLCENPPCLHILQFYINDCKMPIDLPILNCVTS